MDGAGFELIANMYKYDPTLYDLRRYFHNVEKQPEGGKIEFAPVIGEDSNCLVTSLAFIIEKVPVLIQGYAGSGKTQIMEAVTQLIPIDKKVTVKVSSTKSIWYKMKEINSKDYVVISEYQKVTGDFMEVLKDWGERRRAQYDVTDITMDKGEDQVKTKVLPYKPFLTSKAYENKQAEVTEELGRRVIQLFTNSSISMNERILEYKLQCKAKKNSSMRTMSDTDIEKLKLHIAECIDLPDFEVINPAAPALLEYIPKTFRISCSLVNYYLQIVDAIAKFFFKKRIIVTESGESVLPEDLKSHKEKLYLIATPEDNYLAWAIYGEQFIESCLEMNVVGRQILSAFPKVRAAERVDGTYAPKMDETMTETELIEAMRAKGVVLKRGEVRKKINELIITGYIDEFEGGSATSRAKRFYKTQMAAHLLDKEDAIDWRELRQVTITNINAEFPENSKDYMDRYCNNDFETTDPFTGKPARIFKAKQRKIKQHKKDDDETVKGILTDMEVDKDDENTKQQTFNIT